MHEVQARTWMILLCLFTIGCLDGGSIRIPRDAQYLVKVFPCASGHEERRFAPAGRSSGSRRF